MRNTLTKEGLVVNQKKSKHLFDEKELIQFTNIFWTVDLLITAIKFKFPS